MSRRKLLPKERIWIHGMFQGHCAYCGIAITLEEMQVDHIYPINRGGADELNNMYPACRSCNHYKATMTVEQFRAALERMPEILMRDSVTYKNAVRFGLIHPTEVAVIFYFEKSCQEIN